MRRSKYSCTNAVKEVCHEMQVGERLKGYELYERVLTKLAMNGIRDRPLDSTVLRKIRSEGGYYGVNAINHSVSIYKKEQV